MPRTAVPFVIHPVLPTFRTRHPRVEVEVVIEERLVDIVAEGYDAGVRLSEAIQRDIVQVRLTDGLRFVVVGAPDYLEREGTPRRPEDLLHHECITFRSQTTGALYVWELERGRRTWRVPARGGVVTNDHVVAVSLAAQGMGLAYAFEPPIAEHLRGMDASSPSSRRTRPQSLATSCISRAARSGPLRLFVEAAKELAVRTASGPELAPTSWRR